MTALPLSRFVFVYQNKLGRVLLIPRSVTRVKVVEIKMKSKGHFQYVEFELFIAETIKNDVFWDVVPCISRVNRRFVDTYLRNVGSHKIYTVRHPRRRHSFSIVYVSISFLKNSG
jgi:hypothetical protein